MKIPTISIAEYCVGGNINELPLRNMQIIPFNLEHSTRTGEFARIAFLAKRNGNVKLSTRNLIPNDTKLFAQADIEKSITFYLSSDKESQKIYEILKNEVMPKFQFLDLNIPHNEAFGLLDL